MSFEVPSYQTIPGLCDHQLLHPSSVPDQVPGSQGAAPEGSCLGDEAVSCCLAVAELITAGNCWLSAPCPSMGGTWEPVGCSPESEVD